MHFTTPPSLDPRKSTLKQRLLGAARWTLVGHFTAQLLRFGSNLILTRLLAPDLFGVMSVGYTVFTGLGMVSDLGLGAVVARSRRGDDPTFLNVVWIAQIGRGVLMTLGALGLSAALGLGAANAVFPAHSVYADPRLPGLLAVVSLYGVVYGLESTKSLWARRNLSLAALTKIDLITQLGTTIFILTWAWISPSIWALGVGWVFGAALKAVLTHWKLPGPRNRFEWDRAAFAEIIDFGKWALVSSPISFLLGSGDRLILGHLRLLSLVVLFPVAVRLARRSDPPAGDGQPAGLADRSRLQADLLIVLYVVLQIALQMPYEALTATLRRVVLIGIDLGLPYYVLSRSCRTRESMVEVMAAFALAMFVLTPLAVVEFFKGWLLYAGLQEQWGTAQVINYLRRGSFLRAQVTSGHSIVLGYAMTLGFGFWLFLQGRVAPVGWRALAMLTLLVGMAMPSARGPWLGAVLVVLVFLALGPNRGSRTLKTFGALALLSAIAVVSPYGDQIIERLPFIGTLDEGTVAYRQQLASMSWLLIQQNPWFGTPGYLAYLEDLRQGQGIIDLVNAYAGIALAYGLVTLAVFIWFFGLIIAKCIRSVRSVAQADPDLSLLGASLVACMVGGLFMIATVNLYLSVANLTWSLAGLGVAYVGLVRRQVPASDGRPVAVDAAAAAWPVRGFGRPAATRTE